MKRAKFPASVNRFRDRVSLYVGDGATVYLDPGEAIKLAQALTLCARDCRATAFENSAFKGKDFEFGG
jgi:hypothetical protein